MEWGDVRLLQQRVAGWLDIVEFEIIPVTNSQNVLETLRPLP
jgi:hypothetical protein